MNSDLHVVDPKRFRMYLRKPTMGSYFELIVDGDRPAAELRVLMDEAWELVQHLVDRLSAHVPASDVCFINEHAFARPVLVDPDLFGLLQQAAAVCEFTGGAFDVTIGPLVKLWGFFAREGRVPSDAEIEEAMGSVGMGHVELNPAARTVRFHRPGMEINLGAIGKGFVIDKVVAMLRRSGVTCALVNAGGSSIFALGAPPDGSDGWRVGLRPGGTAMERLGVVELRDQAFGTSGDHEQHFVTGGVRYGHILDPRTGRPVCHRMTACSLGDSATRTDALSTALAVMGPEEARRFCVQHGESAVVIDESGEGAPVVEAIRCTIRPVAGPPQTMGLSPLSLDASSRDGKQTRGRHH
jgi:thiamine biosynthesis lipoprotein